MENVHATVSVGWGRCGASHLVTHVAPGVSLAGAQALVSGSDATAHLCFPDDSLWVRLEARGTGLRAVPRAGKTLDLELEV